MARQRMHKPELITHAPFTECSVNAQLTVILLQNFCDDYGNHPAHIKSIKAQIFPAHDFTCNDVEGFINELIKHEMICEYEAENKRFYHINGWDLEGHPCYQTVNKPQPSMIPKFEHSLIVHGTVTECSRLIEDKIIEDKIIEDKHMSNLVVKKNTGRSADVEKIFEHWQKTFKHSKTKMNDEHEKQIRRALKTYSVDECLDAITGCSLTPHNMGQNEQKQIYDGLHIIFNLKTANVERFIANKNNAPDSAAKVRNNEEHQKTQDFYHLISGEVNALYLDASLKKDAITCTKNPTTLGWVESYGGWNKVLNFIQDEPDAKSIIHRTLVKFFKEKTQE